MLLKFLPLLSLLMLTAGDATDDKDTDDTRGEDVDDDAPEDTAALKNAYEREKQRRKQLAADLKAARDAQDELDALKDAQAKAEADRQREADEAKGDYEAAKAAIEQERDAAATERDTLKAERDALLALVKADVDTQWDALPDEVKEAFDGNDDDVLARKQHMNRMAKVIARLTEKAHTPGNGPNPKPSDGDTKTNIREALKAIRYT